MAARENELSALDQIALWLSIFLSLGLLSTPFLLTPAFMGMFKDFASLETLPGLTKLVSQTWFPMVCALPGLVLALTGLLGSASMFRRRLLITASFFVALAANGFYLCGMYAPIFNLASAIE